MPVMSGLILAALIGGINEVAGLRDDLRAQGNQVIRIEERTSFIPALLEKQNAMERQLIAIQIQADRNSNLVARAFEIMGPFRQMVMPETAEETR
jgi:hypothetical protein